VSGAGGTIIIAPQEHLAFLPASAGFQAKDFPHASQANLLLAPATIDPLSPEQDCTAQARIMTSRF
jgi:hypothetical protein